VSSRLPVGCPSTHIDNFPVFLAGLLRGLPVGSVIKKRRKRMAKKKHRKLLKKTRIQRRRAGK